jgi:hypothetical protein
MAELSRNANISYAVETPQGVLGSVLYLFGILSTSFKIINLLANLSQYAVRFDRA